MEHIPHNVPDKLSYRKPDHSMENLRIRGWTYFNGLVLAAEVSQGAAGLQDGKRQAMESKMAKNHPGSSDDR
jgi:hypothetical protein